MNFLAHLYLAEPASGAIPGTTSGVASGPAMVGNLLPDLVRGRRELELDPLVEAGARRHRAVDRFTDAHPMFLQSRKRLWHRLQARATSESASGAASRGASRSASGGGGGRYAGILTDVFYDHILSRDWSRYHPLPLAEFIAEAHARLAASEAAMPEPMRPIIARMIEENWLSTYATLNGLRLTLTRMSHRFSERFGREVRLQDAVQDLPELRPALGEDFHAFFPELIAFVERG